MSELIHFAHENMSEISMHIRYSMFYDFQLESNVSAAAPIYVLHLVLRMALVQISLKDLVKVIRQWKIIRGLDVLYNLE